MLPYVPKRPIPESCGYSLNHAVRVCVKVTSLTNADQSSLFSGSPNGFSAAKRILHDSAGIVSNLFFGLIVLLEEWPGPLMLYSLGGKEVRRKKTTHV